MKWILLLLLAAGCCFVHQVQCWTYHYSNHTMSWDQARHWCRSIYTDMVIIRSQQENHYLVSRLPDRSSSPYYWIGMVRRGQNQNWTWVGDNSTWIDPNLWAPNEPNYNLSADMCVEIYVNDKNSRGTWNDEQCHAAKYAVCYQAQCGTDSCERGTCLELPDTITCLCDDGVKRGRCPTAVTYPPRPPPTLSDDRMNLTCRFKCHSGFMILRTPEVTCGVNGTWTGPRPLCANYRYALIALSAFGGVTFCCCCVCCWRKRRRRNTAAYVRGLDGSAHASSEE